MSLALYRKYRPGTFAEVKGQEHVTDPLRQALRTGRINHAYLFSGPRGCGKTSSARILARSLNCEKGPTPDPCGECESCVALAPTGPGHLDVIEIDAASHGGVDDARDLRERAFFAPVSARFKIYIIDEAHMVTREGFNALLKLVEEPPPHLKFIFATTEPEKVIGTIKSRTHHYPFRLMPPATLKTLMEEILSSESVPYEPTALPLVVRAGAGSARDSLSILDQLLAGADDDGITYAKAVSLLGYTDGDLLDEVVDAFARRDGAAVFQTVNRVIEGGHDPRRFAADLLERFRDLVILANVPEAATSGLLDRPADELERLVAQASSMGPAELTRAAELFNAGLTEMRGATSPRLLLELMCARVLLPGAAQGEGALLARLERLERGGVVAQMASRPGAGGTAGAHGASPQVTAAASHGETAAPYAGAAGPSSVAAAVPGSQDASGSAGTASGAPGASSGSSGAASGPSGPSAGSAGISDGTASSGTAAGAVAGSPASSGGDDWPETVRPGAPAAQPEQPVQQQPVQQAPAYAAPTQGGAGQLQQQWPAVLAALKKRSIVVWANVNTNAQVVGVEGNVVTLGFTQVGAMKNFTGGGKDAVVASALGDVLGGTWRVEAVVGGSPAPQGRSAQPGPSAPSAPHSGSHGAPVASQGAPHGGQGVSQAGPHGVAGVPQGGPQGVAGASFGDPAGSGSHSGGAPGTGVHPAGAAEGGAPADGAPGHGAPGGGVTGAGGPGAVVGGGFQGGGAPEGGVPGGGFRGGAPGAVGAQQGGAPAA
ncbi:DNA polymerase III subunit gamma and tau [Nonomuraea dietziae]|uniref:DNA polymerase III subunit gamma and tau n=1 Tax=Nonomuraea dietziae TaxID=65515 RepID=UPI0031DCD6A4